MNEHQPSPAPAGDAPAQAPSDAQPAGNSLPTPAQFHATLLDQFRQSLAAEGLKAYERWGLALWYSLEPAEIETQREAMGIEPVDALDAYNRGCLLAQRQQYDAAAAWFERATQRDPELAEAAFNHALALELAGHRGQARKAWVKYLEMHPDSPDAAEIKQRLTALADA